MITPTNMLEVMNNIIVHNYKYLPLLRFEMYVEAHHLILKCIYDVI